MISRERQINAKALACHLTSSPKQAATAPVVRARQHPT